MPQKALPGGDGYLLSIHTHTRPLSSDAFYKLLNTIIGVNRLAIANSSLKSRGQKFVLASKISSV
jgi:hypothetical protein